MTGLSEKQKKAVRDEITRCRNDFEHFAKHLRILDRYTEELASLRLNPAQHRLHTSLKFSSSVFVLKARQLGSSTYFLARAFWRAWRQPGHNVLVVAHTGDAVKALFKTVHRYNKHLPVLLGPAPETSRTEITLPNGSTIRVATAQSASMRSQTYSTILLTEFAFYDQPDVLIAAAVKTLTPNGELYLETTANGLNWAHEQWTREPSAYNKVFLSWRLDPHARATSLAEGATVTQELADLAKQEGWSKEELFWAANTLERDNFGNWHMFCQETPSNPTMCFVTSGARVFPRIYFPDATSNPPEGYLEFLPPDRLTPLAMGVDVGGGSPTGDYSAFSIVDKDFNLFASYRARVSIVDFANVIQMYLKRYSPLLAIEINGLGLGLHDIVVKSGYYNLYRRPDFSTKLAAQLQDRTGWQTTDITRNILVGLLYRNLPRMDLSKEPRLQAEVNTYEFDRRGHPGHNQQGHDDLLMSLAIAMAATEQLFTPEAVAHNTRPRTTAEIAAWQQKTDQIYSDNLQFDDDLDDRTSYGSISSFL